MKQWRKACKKLLYPGAGGVVLAVLLGGGSLALTFLVFGADSPFAYVSYLLSSYGLIVLVAAAVPLTGTIRRRIMAVPLARRYAADRYFQVRVSLLLSFLINLCYAGCKLACAVLYLSFWEGALAVYNILLCAVRVYLLRHLPKDEQDEPERDARCVLRQYRAIGIALILLDLALSGIAVQIVRDGYGYSYPGTLIYAVACHTFYSLTLAVINIVKYHRFHSPLLSAAKDVNLTTALVALFNLETAMVGQFGGDDAAFRLTMTAGTAAAVCAFVLGMAIYMVASANRKLRKL